MNADRDEIRRLVIAANSYDGVYEMICKKMGIKVNMLWLLYALDDNKFHTQKQICEEWLFPKTTVNTLIKECKTAGYVTLHTVPGKRELQVCLTEKGKAYVKKALNIIYEAEENAIQMTMQGHDAEFMRTFVSTLEILVENFKTAFDKATKELE